MKIISIIASTLIVSIHVIAQTDSVALNTLIGKTKEEAKINLRKTNPNWRIEALKVMDVLDKSPKHTQVVELLNDNCKHLGAPYTLDQSGFIIRPHITCEYKPKNKEKTFNGATPKFACETTSSFINKDDKDEIKKETYKVKYDVKSSLFSGSKPRPGGGYKEIPQAIIGSTMAHLMGFTANKVCPADITCIGCPSNDPWGLNNKSTDSYAKNKSIEFKNVVLVDNADGEEIIDNKNTYSTKEQGLNFNSDMLPTASFENKIEREALAIWVNFLMHSDSDPHNNRLLCILDKVKNQDTKEVEGFKCKKIKGMVSDYGDSIGYRGDSDKKIALSKFKEKLPIKISHDKLTTQGAAESARNYPVSIEGIKLFVGLLRKVSVENYKDIFSLAQVEITTDASKDRNEAIEIWTKSFQEKIDLIEAEFLK